jgi:hypothetical protein
VRIRLFDGESLLEGMKEAERDLWDLIINSEQLSLLIKTFFTAKHQ